MNTQICTNMEQSKRLLKLGLNDDTADMFHPAQHIGKDIVRYSDPQMLVHNDHFEIFVDDLPAWSLHRLIGLLGEDRLPVSLHRKGEASIKLNQLHPRLRGGCGYSHYDSIIDIIEYLISRNMFNEEYLEG